jgi:hypothetical protein
MKRHTPLLAVLIATLVACATTSAAGAATPGLARATLSAAPLANVARASLLTSATVTACATGAVDADRSATFSAVINAVPHTSTMSVSFDLYEKTSATSGFVSVTAPGFGVWQTSTRGIASFTANDNVVDLPAPASFRALVHYRWLNRRGHVIRRDARVTPACVQTAPEPNLFVVRISHAAGTPAKTNELYGVVVRNSGLGDAGAFEVALTVNGAPLADQQVTGLVSLTTSTVQFSGPRCTAGSTITAQVDPAGAIIEPANADRTFSMACPTVSDSTASAAVGSTGATGG